MLLVVVLWTVDVVLSIFSRSPEIAWLVVVSRRHQPYVRLTPVRSPCDARRHGGSFAMPKKKLSQNLQTLIMDIGELSTLLELYLRTRLTPWDVFAKPGDNDLWSHLRLKH